MSEQTPRPRILTSQSAGMFVHGLTWRGRASAVYYCARRLLVRPASPAARCFMGSVVDPMVHCPRRAGDELWCARHRSEIVKTALPPQYPL